jgi:hypothetical protein
MQRAAAAAFYGKASRDPPKRKFTTMLWRQTESAQEIEQPAGTSGSKKSRLKRLIFRSAVFATDTINCRENTKVSCWCCKKQ